MSKPEEPGRREAAADWKKMVGRALAIVAAVCILIVGAEVVWQRVGAPTPHEHMMLPALPDLTGKPALLRDRLVAANAAIAGRPAQADAVVELARLYHANGYSTEAAACWGWLHSQQPREAKWCYYLAALRRGGGDSQGDEALLSDVTRLAPSYAPAWLLLAQLQFKSGRLDLAQRSFDRRLALLPGDPYARLGLARVALQQDRRDEAKRLLGQLVHDAPHFPPSLNLYAEILAGEGDAAGAAKERALAVAAGRFREADDPWLDELSAWCFDYDQLCLRGTVDALTNFGDRGQSSFERAIQIRPDALNAYELLGNHYVDLNDAAHARDIYEQGLRRAKNAKPSPKFFVNLSRVYCMLKQPAEAVRVARAGLAEVGEEVGLYDALGTALAELGQPQAAVEALRTAVAHNATDTDANYHLALALIAVNRLDEAVESLHRSLIAQPTFPSSLMLLAQIEIDSGRWQTAAQYLQPVYESHPELPEARHEMAYCHLRAGAEAESHHDLPAAEQHYRAGVSIERDNAQLQARLGALCLIQHRFADAIEPLEAYHRLQPENAESALYLGQAYAALGRRREAREVLTAGARLADRAGNATLAQYCRKILKQLP